MTDTDAQTTNTEESPPRAAIPRKPRWKRLARWALVAGAVVVALIVLACLMIEWTCYASPPAIAEAPPAVSAPVQDAGGTRRIGKNWLARRDGIYRMRLSGDPFTLGYTNALLTEDLIVEQEKTLLDFIHEKVPSAACRFLLKKYVLVRNRRLPDFVPLEYQTEIYGLSRAYHDPYPQYGHLYHRMLNYHAAHDIAHAVMDLPTMGCTSLAAWGPMTEGGHLLLARNFDFAVGDCFDTNKIVVLMQPDKGYAFISVIWAGMSGAVSGMNAQRIAITINAATSDDKAAIGTPVTFVVRRVLQYAATLDEAIEIVRSSHVFVSDMYLVADGKSGRAVVIEKTPLRCAVYRTEGSCIICTNHFRTDELKDDPANLRYMAEATSVRRYDRLQALVTAAKPPLTPAVLARFLRDRTVEGYEHVALGNDAAINPLIASHAVVMDVTAGVIWVSASPHQLGRFVPFSLREFDRPKGVKPLAADPLLDGGAYERFCQSRDRLVQAQKLLKKRDYNGAARLAREAADLNPGFYRPHLLLGKIAFARHEWKQAEESLDAAMRGYPAYGSEREAIQEMLRKIRTARNE